jgi:Tol biopolymer transport system component
MQRVIAFVAAAVLFPAVQARADAGDVQLASRASGLSGVKSDGPSSEPKLSADGRFAAFTTTAANLDPADADTAFDVYVRDLQTGATMLVSRADGAQGAKGDAASGAPAISADGRYVAFVSDATNLSPDDQDDVADVFVRDVQQHTTTLVSRASGGEAGDAPSGAPSISAAGRVVAFESDSANLAPDDTDELTDVFARDVLAGTTVLVSGPGADPRTGLSTQPSISADGTVVAFSSTVTELDPDDGDELSDVFTRNLLTGALALVSRGDGATGEKGDGASDSPAISGDGRSVAFRSTAANLDPADLDAVADVFLRDLALGTTAIVSRSDGPAGGKGLKGSASPAISRSGRFVVFTSLSAFDSADADALADVYSRELATGRTRLLSRAAGVLGAKGDGESDSPAISADARFVAYASVAANLHPDDADAITDVFVRDVLGAVRPLGPPFPRTAGTVTVPGRFPVAPASCRADGAVTVLTDGADHRTGGPGTDILIGRGGPDVLRGMDGRDCLYGGAGADRLIGGRGDDVLSGGAGNDVIDARDGRRGHDRVRCGPGSRDRALVDRRDVVARDCERVIGRRKPRTTPRKGAKST